MAVVNIAPNFEKQDLLLNQQSQLFADTLVIQENGIFKRKKRLTRVTKFFRYSQVDVTIKNVDILLLTCYFIFVLTDSVIYNGIVLDQSFYQTTTNILPPLIQ